MTEWECLRRDAQGAPSRQLLHILQQLPYPVPTEIAVTLAVGAVEVGVRSNSSAGDIPVDTAPDSSPPGGEVVVYQAPGGEIRVDVRVERESVWLTQQQMAELFGRERSVISKHLRNVFREAELLEESNVQILHITGTYKPVSLYSLDVIISVGYRVRSPRGTDFRIWATRTLREHLLRGYTLHERRIAERGLEDLQQAVGLLAKTLESHDLVTEEGRAVLYVVERYSRTWRLLKEYDEQRLPEEPARPVRPGPVLDLADARAAVATIRTSLGQHGQSGALFGQERGEALSGTLAAVDQTFDARPLYRSAQARAAHLLYLVIKDHPYVDGNKRIGVLLFLEYLRRHGLLLSIDGRTRVPDTALVAVALLIAASAPTQKELLVRLVISLLEDSSEVRDGPAAPPYGFSAADNTRSHPDSGPVSPGSFAKLSMRRVAATAAAGSIPCSRTNCM